MTAGENVREEDAISDALIDTQLASLIAALRLRGYRFVTPTPATHTRVLQRASRQQGRSLTDIFGWSLPFHHDDLDGDIAALLRDAGLLLPTDGGLWRLAIRVSSLHQFLFAHSAYPTEDQDSVFFGPDSYRFADAIAAELGRQQLPDGAHILDIGTGSGVGAIIAGSACPGAFVTMTDINPKALSLARINASAAGVPVHGRVDHDLTTVEGQFHFITANPPYVIDPAGRAYRDGGDSHGAAVALAMTGMALPRLLPGGRFLLYTGSAIIDGEDPLRDRLVEMAARSGCAMRYREVDPDVFGEELSHTAYEDVDRIAIVVAVFTCKE